MAILSETIDEIGWQRHTTWVVAIVWTTWFSSGWIGTLFPFLLDAAGEQDGDWFRMTQTTLSTWEKSAILLGAGCSGMIGNGGLGYWSDRYGRSSAVRVSMILCMCVVIAFAFVRSPLGLGILIVLTPFSRDGISMISGTLAAEWIPSSERGLVLTLCHGVWNIGRLSLTLWWTLVPPKTNWVGFLIGAAVVPIGIALWWTVSRRKYESPRWNSVHGKSEEARLQMGRLGFVGEVDAEDSFLGLTKKPKVSRVPQRMFHLGAIAILLFFASGSCAIWFIVFLERQAPGNMESSLLAAPIARSAVVVALVAGQSGKRLIDRWSRTRMLQGGFVVVSVCWMLIRMPILSSYLTPIVFVLNVSEEIIWSAWGLLLTETFPTSVRTSAIGVISMVGHIGSILGTTFSGELLDIDPSLPLLVWAACMGVGGILSFFLPTYDHRAGLSDFLE